MKTKSLFATCFLLLSIFARVDSASATATNLLNIQHFQLVIRGTGNFDNENDFSVDGNPNSVVAADVNGDGYIDLICDDGATGINVLTNDGTGNFSNDTDIPVGNVSDANPTPVDVIAADVNGDGKVDLISANRDEQDVTVLTNDGAGNFVIATNSSVGKHPVSLAYADIYGNGNPALITANEQDYTLTVLTNKGGGIFVSNATYVVGIYLGPGENLYTPYPESVTAADVNNDGKADLICVDRYGYFGRYTNNLIVLTNNGSGIFFSNAVYTVGNGPYSVKAFTNVDGKVDLVTANNFDGTLTVLTNNGSGHFGVYSNLDVGLSSPGSAPLSVAVADINGDGKPDLISADSGDNTVTILTNNGSGGFVLDITYTVNNSAFSAIAADVTGSGGLDLAVADNTYGNVSVLSAVTAVLTNVLSGSIVLAWPTNNTAGYVLQQNSNLAATSNWVNVTNPQTTLLGTNQVVDVLTSTNRFYRLRHP